VIDIRRRLPVVLAAAGLISVGAGIGIAASKGEGAGPPIKFFPLATATLEPFSGDVHLKDGGQFRISITGANTIFAIREVTVAPGAALPWHQHPGSAVILLAKGTLTEYNTAFPHCGPLTRTAPYSRFEPGNSTHMLVNNGKVGVVLLVASWDAPKVVKSGKLIIPEPQPKLAGCPAAP
jgi:hypothetical protein